MPVSVWKTHVVKVGLPSLSSSYQCWTMRSSPSQILFYTQHVISICKKFFLLNKECSFAVLLQSVCHKKSPKFSKKHPASTVLFKRTIFRTMWKLWNEKFNAAQNESMKMLCSNWWQTGEIGPWMETSLRKSLCQLRVQTTISTFWACKETKLLTTPM